jgi:aldehyde:ferredoxin oxidoreductase
MKGIAGKILFVNLTTGKVSIEIIEDDIYRKYLGGRGLGAKLLYDHSKPGVDPLSPENIVVVMTGPATGTPIPSGCKYVVLSKSPATGAFLEAYSSGRIAQELKYAGYDGIIVSGKSEYPCIIKVNNDTVEILNASHIWGKDALETEKMLKNEFGSEYGVMCIGPAGENLSYIAGINSDFYRQAARGGGGAVFGSKNLKAVIVRGNKYGVSCEDPETILSLVKQHVQQIENSFMGKIRRRFGTPYTLTLTNAAGMLPTRNFQSGICKGAEDVIGAEAVEKRTISSKSCLGCMVSCSKITEVNDGPYKGLVIEGPEYETLSMLGSNLGVLYLPAILKGNEVCDRLGIDTISTGATISFAMECYEKGLLKDFDLGGMDLSFGNYEVAIKLMYDIAYGKGFGEVLKNGVKRASEIIGQDSYKFAMQVKGLEFPGYDPRASFGAALTYAVTPRGACHRRCWPPAKDILKNVNPYEAQGKAAIVKKIWNSNSIYHTILICDIPPKNIGISMSDVVKYLNALTGENYTQEDMDDMAERTETLIRLFNIREGFTRNDDTLPYRILHEPSPEGPPKGICVGVDNLNLMLDEYYELRGWDKNGNPRPETLDRLGIKA